ncbi:methyltransferase family protein [Haloactinospora alba]|uniref:Methyltransferase family protein n=1 Tax=Haloactinospora alba TaxID=405555 RepID=A0A543NJZ0_9ACTN|nr:class I SAM-dependent methyltransferase [Haloactinospora alba]TQN32126.1 methyltransferase family protein [Haloactinospora alba]
MARRELWTGSVPRRSPFAFPRGFSGRLAGRIMARTNRARNTEVSEALEIGPQELVLEVGHGPGLLLRDLARRTGEPVTGVDPSPEMVAMARERNADLVREGRLRLRTGSACATGAATDSVDLVLSMNTIAMWPRLDDGFAEFLRVLRPGGRVVVTWHRRPRRFALTPEELGTIAAAMRRRFCSLERVVLRESVMFRAVAPPGTTAAGNG